MSYTSIYPLDLRLKPRRAPLDNSLYVITGLAGGSRTMFSGGLSEEICLPFLAMADINLPIPSNEAEPHRHTLESF